jgi:CBS domain-containing protein
MTKSHTVADIMAKKLHTLRPDDDIATAVSMFLKYKISGAPVVDAAGKLIGVLSEKDCMRLLVGSFFEGDHRVQSEHVEDFMTKEVRTIPSSMTVVEVASLFHSTPYRRLPVVDGGDLVGQVSRRDVLQAIDASLRDTALTPSASEMGSMITEGAANDLVGPATNRRFGN